MLELGRPRFMCACQSLDKETVSTSVPGDNTDLFETPQIVHDVLALAKVDFLQ